MDAADESGNTVVAIIKPTDKAFNVIPSVYGKKEIENLIKSSDIRYVNDIEIPATASIDLASLQLRGGDSARGNNNNILHKSDIVNSSLYQEMSGRPKGAYMEKLGHSGIIYLFEKADASTFMHETAQLPNTYKNPEKIIKGFHGGKAQEYRLKQYYNPETQKDVYDIIPRNDSGMLLTKFARENKKRKDKFEKSI